MIDRVRYCVPAGPLGRALDGLVLRRYLERLLRTRNDWLRAQLADEA